MFRDQVVNFLASAVVFLLMMNTISVMVAMYAVRLANGLSHQTVKARTAVERKLDSVLRIAS